MASPGELVQCIARALGVPENQVTQHDRNLAVAGLRTVGGRGRSAARMSPRDAANLLIGVAASSMVKDTVETVMEYGSLPVRGGSVSKKVGRLNSSSVISQSPDWKLPLPALQRLPLEGHTLGDALAALIEDAAGAGIASLKAEVMFYSPVAHASLRLDTGDGSENKQYSAQVSEVEDLVFWRPRAMKDSGDLSQVRSFSGKTIRALGALLGD